MLVKQIDRKTALELAAKGVTVNILAPSTPDPQEWMDYEPDTLDNLLDKCLFFRQVPAVENEAFEAAVRDMISEGCCENAADSDKALPGSQPEPGPSEEPSGGGSREEPTGKVSSTKRKKVDTGKLLALRKAGWSMKKIGEELGISEGSVFNYLKKLEEDEVVKRIAESGKGDKG